MIGGSYRKKNEISTVLQTVINSMTDARKTFHQTK